MVLYLNALQLNVSHFGRKYPHNNGVNEMAGLGTNLRVYSVWPDKHLEREVMNVSHFGRKCRKWD